MFSLLKIIFNNRITYRLDTYLFEFSFCAWKDESIILEY